MVGYTFQKIYTPPRQQALSSSTTPKGWFLDTDPSRAGRRPSKDGLSAVLVAPESSTAGLWARHGMCRTFVRRLPEHKIYGPAHQITPSETISRRGPSGSCTQHRWVKRLTEAERRDPPSMPDCPGFRASDRTHWSVDDRAGRKNIPSPSSCWIGIFKTFFECEERPRIHARDPSLSDYEGKLADTLAYSRRSGKYDSSGLG